MLKEFKEFIMKGNVLELAVAVIIAGAFGAIIVSFTNDVLMPPIGMMLGGVDFEDLKYVIQAGQTGPEGEVIVPEVAVLYGKFINTIINFLIIAFIIFLIVRSYNNMQKQEEEAPAAPAGPSQEELLADIRDILKRQ